MKEFTYTIKDPLGIHARPAGTLVKTAEKFTCEITIHKEDKTADAKRIFSVMSLGVKEGDEIKLTFSGTDEVNAFDTLQNFLKENL